MICPIIDDDSILNGECVENKVVQMKTSDGKDKALSKVTQDAHLAETL